LAAIDIAVQKGFNSFAEHLNNLLHETVADQGEASEEKDQPLVTSFDGISVGDASNDSEQDLDKEYQIYPESEADEEILHFHSDGEHDYVNPNDDKHDYVNPNDDKDCANIHGTAIMLEQLRQMTYLAKQQTDELHLAKSAVSDLQQQNSVLKHDLSMSCAANAQMKEKLAVYRGDNDSNLTQKSLAELVALEEEVKLALDHIVTAKEMAMIKKEEERVCVICKEKAKCVLLMPCRHLCVCKECGYHNSLVQCPLCRKTITERINVFA